MRYKRKFFGTDDCRIACLVGAIKPAKDYHLALDTAARLVRLAPDWRVLFLGDQLASAGGYRAGLDSDTSSYKDQIVRHHRRIGLADRVKFAGARGDAAAIMKQCDVVFSTSCREGFPNVVLEAMALGVPVVSTDYSDIRRILPHESQVVEERSPAAMARAILNAHAHRDAIAADQRRWVREHASIERAATELESVYRIYLRPNVLAQAA